MIVAGRNDTDAADALSVLAADAATADRIAGRVAGLLADPATGPPARGRLPQALASLPGDAATRALAGLTRDDDPAAALTAVSLLRFRGTGGPPS
ncbi:hypothetical protein JK356_01710 [Streptomyces sp. 7-21]|nr:hypothetical protein [Streptomyces sp. 7-21]